MIQFISELLPINIKDNTPHSNNENPNAIIASIDRPKAEDRIPPGLKSNDTQFLNRVNDFRQFRMQHPRNIQKINTPTFQTLKENSPLRDQIMIEEKQRNGIEYIKLLINQRLALPGTSNSKTTQFEIIYRMNRIDDHSPVSHEELPRGLSNFLNKGTIIS
jgi:hypothetical protein